MMLPFEYYQIIFPGNDWRYLSNTEQSYKQYGAYYDRVKGKLQVQNEMHNKV